MLGKHFTDLTSGKYTLKDIRTLMCSAIGEMLLFDSLNRKDKSSIMCHLMPFDSYDVKILFKSNDISLKI